MVFVWNRTKEVLEDADIQHLVLENICHFTFKEPDLVVEVAHPSITKTYGALILKYCDYMVCIIFSFLIFLYFYLLQLCNFMILKKCFLSRVFWKSDIDNQYQMWNRSSLGSFIAKLFWWPTKSPKLKYWSVLFAEVNFFIILRTVYCYKLAAVIENTQ